MGAEPLEAAGGRPAAVEGRTIVEALAMLKDGEILVLENSSPPSESVIGRMIED
jgi:hypothetical protein